ncbi:MAG: hypothetical protein ABJA98_29155 [Acidobacteriota bacterium]
MTARNELNAFWDEQRGCSGAGWIGTTSSVCRQTPDDWIVGGSATNAPETGTSSGPPNRIWQATWVSTLSNRAQADKDGAWDAGGTAVTFRWTHRGRPSTPTLSPDGRPEVSLR